MWAVTEVITATALRQVEMGPIYHIWKLEITLTIFLIEFRVVSIFIWVLNIFKL